MSDDEGPPPAEDMEALILACFRAAIMAGAAVGVLVLVLLCLLGFVLASIAEATLS